MGGVNTKNQAFRCPNCCQLYNITIAPGKTNSLIYLLCYCPGQKVIPLAQFLQSAKIGKQFIFHCSNCKKEASKIVYCYDCKKTYCAKCNQLHKNRQSIQVSNKKDLKFDTNEEKVDNAYVNTDPNTMDVPNINEESKDNKENQNSEKKNDANHNRTIEADKIDFYCVNHQKNLFTGYCYKCKENICDKCISENLHSGHNFESFSTLLMDKKEKEVLQNKMKFAKLKIEYNRKAGELLIRDAKKKVKAEDLTQLQKLLNYNENTNNNILELMNYIIDMIEKIKEKNYTIIQNLSRNNRFNVDRLKFGAEKNIAKDVECFKNYLSKSYVLHRPKLRKAPPPPSATATTAKLFSEKPPEEAKQSEVVDIIENKTPVVKKKKAKKKALNLEE